MENKYGINEKNYKEILDIFAQIPQIEKVVLFGSRARGDYKNTSDIDLAVKFKKEDKKLFLINKLEELNCILKFDVLNIDKIDNVKLLENIEKEGIILYNSCIKL